LITDCPTVNVISFELQFPLEEIGALARRFPNLDDTRLEAVGSAVRARGHYTRGEFIEVCAWKTPRSRPKIAANSARVVTATTRRALGTADEAERMAALLELQGVGVPTASTLLYAAFPQDYPILDVRALESLGVKARSSYPVSFWLAYLEACRAIARASGVSLRTLDQALWQRSKELSVARAGDPVDRRSAGARSACARGRPHDVPPGRACWRSLVASPSRRVPAGRAPRAPAAEYSPSPSSFVAL
jgi:hypothetical protein